MSKNDNNLAWKIATALCLLFFGFFLYFYLLKNRNQSYQIVAEASTNDQETLSNDWKNVFQDLQTAFQKQILA